MHFLGLRISGGKYPAWLNILALASIVMLTLGAVGLGVHEYDRVLHTDDHFYFYAQRPWAVLFVRLGLFGGVLFFFSGWLASKYEKP